MLLLLGAGAVSAPMTAPAAAQVSGEGSERFTVWVEGGPVWQSRNEVRVPNEPEATLFSLRSLAGSGPWPAARLTVGWRFRDRQEVRLLLAPLSITETAGSGEAIRFAGQDLEPQLPITATYTFNSWRASWRYRLHEGGSTAGWIGFTAKVRDAVVSLEQEVEPPSEGRGDLRRGRTTDVGFVPLLHLSGVWRIAPVWTLMGEFDGLAGGPGRAFDVSAQVERRIGDRWWIRGGYRTVEGGADVDQVRNFAWLHYLVVGGEWRR
ncbi:MAG: hypothetical protein EA422_00470 [Gemmatimonadales bacterium]|nr:MAG: hypothetical protein EA422_00470 [Gemmatimonadales bacterium]